MLPSARTSCRSGSASLHFVPRGGAPVGSCRCCSHRQSAARPMLLGSQSANCGDRSCHPRPRAARASLQTAPQARCPLRRCLAADRHCARSTQTASRACAARRPPRAVARRRGPFSAPACAGAPPLVRMRPAPPPPRRRTRTRARFSGAAGPCRRARQSRPPLTRASRDLSARRFPPSNTSLSRFASRRRFASPSGYAPLPCLHVTLRFGPALAPCAPHDRNLFARRQTSSAPRARARALSAWRPAAPRVPPDGETPPKPVLRKRSRGVARRRKTRGRNARTSGKARPEAPPPEAKWAGRPERARRARARFRKSCGFL